MSRFADILLPLAQPPYTFEVPDGLTLAEGCAVEVAFGGRKIYAGIVWRLYDDPPRFGRLKTVGAALYDGLVLVGRERRAFWEWIADYYMCTLGEVLRAALPSLLKPSGVDAASFEAELFRPRMETRYRLDPALDEGRLAQLVEKLSRRSPRRCETLQRIARAGSEGVLRSDLTCDSTVLRALGAEGWIEKVVRPAAARRRDELPTSASDAALSPQAQSRSCDLPATDFAVSGCFAGAESDRLPLLSDAQRTALRQIGEEFGRKVPVLLRGVSGAGKTEIYIHLIDRALRQGGDVLLLVPEIALTSQLIARMRRIFGDAVTSYHSKLPARRRTETYLRLANSSGGTLLVGARSALFLPLDRLSLIVVDEEHDSSYKQTDPSPRYHARDSAVMLGRLSGADVLLGSATPSLESYLNAEGGKYGRVVLDERWGGSPQPEVCLSDTMLAVRRGERKGHFNQVLLAALADVLQRGGQAMLFQNRRGYAPYLACGACRWTARCDRCNVPLTPHGQPDRLVCHYCGESRPLPAVCPECGAELRPMGFGTEKIEQEVVRLFPQARVVRLDADAAASDGAFRRIVGEFEQGLYDVMVGTQMITQGFDFGGVELVGVLNADNLLNGADFRSTERAFQLLMQAAGRAGRRGVRGQVIVQSAEPDHPLLEMLRMRDYRSAARMLLRERETIFYPPYSRLIAVRMRSDDRERLHRAAVRLAAALRERFARRVMGPAAPLVDRVRDEWLVQLLLKIEAGASAARARGILRGILSDAAGSAEFKGIKIVVDVDPQ